MTKKYIATLLIITMVLTSGGVSTFASSVEHYAISNHDSSESKNSYKHYHEFKTESILVESDKTITFKESKNETINTIEEVSFNDKEIPSNEEHTLSTESEFIDDEDQNDDEIIENENGEDSVVADINDEVIAATESDIESMQEIEPEVTTESEIVIATEDEVEVAKDASLHIATKNDIKKMDMYETENSFYGATGGTRTASYTISLASGITMYSLSGNHDAAGNPIRSAGIGVYTHIGNWYDDCHFSVDKSAIDRIVHTDLFSFDRIAGTIDEYCELSFDYSTKPANHLADTSITPARIARIGNTVYIVDGELEWTCSVCYNPGSDLYHRAYIRPSLTYGKTNLDDLYSGFENLTEISVSIAATMSPDVYPIINDTATSAKNLFKNCKSLTSIPSFRGSWPNCTNLESAFGGCENLTEINNTFEPSTSLTQLLNCKNLFKGCKRLTSIVSIPTLRSIQTFESMYEDCELLTSISLSLDNFSISTINCEKMFKNCKNLTSITFVDTADDEWNKVRECKEMFYNCQSLTSINLNSINLSQITTADRMFSGCTNLTTISLNDYVEELPITATDMFASCSNLVGGAGFNYYDKDHVDGELARTDHGGLYPGYLTCNSAARVVTIGVTMHNDWFTAFSSDINKASISAIKFYTNADMGTVTKMFRIGAYKDNDTTKKCYAYLNSSNELLLHVPKINTSANANFSGAFKDFTSMTRIDGINLLNVQTVTNLSSLFENDTSLINFDVNGVSNWVIRNTLTNTSKMFYNCRSLQTLSGPIDWNTSNVTDMSYMFASCSELTSLVLDSPSPAGSLFDFNAATNLSYMFAGCKNLSSISAFFYYRNTNNARNMSYMFYDCERLNFDPGYVMIDHLDLNSVTNTESMFENCQRLANISFVSRANNLTNAKKMFKNCRNLQYVTFEAYTGGAANITNMEEMFCGCTALRQLGADYDGLSFNRVQNTKRMLKDCTSLTRVDFQNNNLSNVRDATSMFENCSTLSQIKINSNLRGLNNLIASDNMFKNCTYLKGGNGTKYNPDMTNGSFARVDYGGITPGYFSLNYEDIYDGVQFALPGDWSISNYNKSDIKKIKILREDVGAYDAICTISETNNLYAYREDDVLKINFGAKFNNLKLSQIKGFFKNFTGVTEIEGLDLLDISAITDISSLFENMASISEINAGALNVTNKQNFSNLFKGCKSLESLDLTNWTTTSATNMGSMFDGCESLLYIIVSTDASGNCNFVTTGVTNSTNMFNNCLSLTGEEDTKYTLYGNRDKSFAVIDGGTVSPGYLSPTYNYLDKGWYTGTAVPANQITKITFLKYPIPEPASDESIDIIAGKLKVLRTGTELTVYSVDGSQFGAPTDSSYLFSGENASEKFSELREVVNLNLFITKRAVDMSHMFDGTKITSFDFSTLNLLRAKDFSYFFNNAKDLSTITYGTNFDTKKITNMSYMFNGCHNLNTIDLSQYDTTNVTDMSHMFSGCDNITTINLPNTFNTSNVSNMDSMFSGCTLLTNVNLTQLDTSNVTSMEGMFNDCRNLNSIDVSNFDTTDVTSMKNMFASCSNVTNLNISNFNMQSLTNISGMFNGCSNLSTINLPHSFGNSITDMSKLFKGTVVANLDLDLMNTSNVDNYDEMFKDCSELTTIRVSDLFYIKDTATGNQMFGNADKIKGGNGTKYDSSKINLEYAKGDGVDDTKGYFTVSPYGILLNGNGGTYFDGNLAKTEDIYKGSNTAKLEAPKKVGYIFDNYYVGNNAINDKWIYGNTVHEITAHFTPNKYKVMYDGNGGKGAMPVEIATYGEIYTIKNNLFVNDGYTFGGFEYNGTVYRPGDRPSNLTSEYDGKVKLTAVWNGKEYTIYYHPNGASGSVESEIVRYGIDHKIKKNTFTRDRYTFNGWSLSPDSSIVYEDEAYIFMEEAYRPEIHLYANWKITKLIYGTLELRGNGGYINGVPTSKINYKQNESIQDVFKFRRGYEFVSWMDIDDNVVSYPSICDFEGTKVLIASWAEVTYTIRYHSNNGTGSYEDENVSVLSSNHNLKSIAELGFTKMNNNFIGWTDLDSSTKTVKYADNAPITNNDRKEVIDLYAIWEGYTYTITLHDYDKRATGGNRDKVETFIYGEDKKISGVINNTYTDGDITYILSGWAKADDRNRVIYYDNNKADIIFDIEGGTDGANIDLYSVFVDKSSAVYMTFDGNEGFINGEKRLTVALGTNSYIPYPYHIMMYRKGYDFRRWLDSDKVTEYSQPARVNFTGSKIIYADWTDVGLHYMLKYISFNKDTSSPIMTDEMRGTNESFNLTANSYTRLGYKFAGWDISEDSKTVVYKDGESVKGLGDMYDIVCLYAVWEVKDYSLQFFDEDNNAVGNTKLSYTGVATVLPNTNVKKGKKDVGYVLNGTTNKFYSGQKVTKDNFTILETSTSFNFNGQTERSVYTIVYDANSGKFQDGTDIKIGTISYLDRVTLPTGLIRNSYVFKNWTLDGATYNSTSYDRVEDTYLLARWESKSDDKTEPDNPGGGGNNSGNAGSLGTHDSASFINDRNISFVIETPIYENEYRWIYDNKNRINGMLLSVNSVVAKALMNSKDTKDYYIVNDAYKGMIQLSGPGIYKVSVYGLTYYYGFDGRGNLMTGFVDTSQKTRILKVADNFLLSQNLIANAKIFDERRGDIAKYYLYEADGINRGILWNQTVIVNDIEYRFDASGKVISSYVIAKTRSSWQYDPIINKWQYFIEDREGVRTYYRGNEYLIPYNGTDYAYVFDNNGYLLTGNFSFNGKTYQTFASGQLEGAVIGVK